MAPCSMTDTINGTFVPAISDDSFSISPDLRCSEFSKGVTNTIDYNNEEYLDKNQPHEMKESSSSQISREQRNAAFTIQQLAGIFLCNYDEAFLGIENDCSNNKKVIDEECEFSFYNTMSSPTSILDRKILSSSPSSSSLRSKKRKATHNNRVSFSSKVSTRYYNICLGDNPACSYGLPISLGWDYYDIEEEEEEMYQEFILLDRRRKLGPRRLSYEDRRQLLEIAGYKYDELRMALLELKRVQRERIVTEVIVLPFEDFLKKAKRNLRNIFQVRPPKK